MHPGESFKPTRERIRSSWAWVNLRKSRQLAGLVVVGAIACYFAFRSSHTYYVTYVVDGDTFAIDLGGNNTLVQLAGADAPELHKDERYAVEARKYLIERIEKRRVFLDFLDPSERVDYKHRLLCWTWIEGSNLSHELVVRGLARFSGAAEGEDRKLFVMLQNDARDHQRGIWSSKQIQQATSKRRAALINKSRN